MKVLTNNGKWATLLLLAALLSACGSNLRVYSDYDKSQPANIGMGYKWLDLKAIEGRGMNPLYYNELNDKRIKSAVNSELAARGFAMKPESDIVLHYHIVVENKSSVVVDRFGYFYGPYWQRNRVNVYEYQEGTLLIDMMNSKTNELVWRGWAVGMLDNKDRNYPEATIQKAVRAIFKQFPYKPKA